MNKIVFLGGGGHAKVLIDLINLSKKYKIAGILDPNLKADIKISDVPVMGNDELLPLLYKRGIKNACIAVGSVKDNSKRKVLCEKVKHERFLLPALIHPSALIAGRSYIHDGAQIMAGAIIQVASSIGENTIVNTGAIIEHDCTVGSHVHICPGAVICGGCIIGDGSFIGAGATVLQGIKIGSNAVVAAGAVVIADVTDNRKVMGIPAR